MVHIGNRFVLLEENELSDSCRCLFQVHPNEEIAQFHLCSCGHRIIYDCHRVGFAHIIRSDNGPCYNSKEFQQFLQCYSITHQTSSPSHPRSNGFIERMVGVAKKLMDKAGKEGKPWISGLFDYRVTPQSGNIASPLQLMTQHTPREKNLPQLPSAFGAPEMHQTHQELIKRQGNKPERKYQELLPGTPVWVQHKQNATWEPAIVVNQCAPNSYWIMQENGAEQLKVYRHTRTMLKIRSTPTDGEQKVQMREWSTETDNMEFHIPAFPYGNRNFTVKNSHGHSSSSSLALPLPTLDLPESENFQKTGRKTASLQDHCTQVVLHWEMHLMHQMHQCNVSQQERTLENQPTSIMTNFTCKGTIATWISGFPMENVEL